VGIIGGSALVSSFFAVHLMDFIALPDLHRWALMLMAAITIPEGLTNLLNGSAAGFATYAISIRTLEGFPMGLVEVCTSVLIIRIFPDAEELASAESMFMGFRALVTLASPPLGGALYELGGFTLPYTMIGTVILIGAVILRFTLGQDASSGKVRQSNASVFTVLTYPGTLGCMLGIFQGACNLLCTDVLYQPWLGVQPYAFTPFQISSVQICAAGCLMLAAMAAMAIADPKHKILAAFIGTGISTLGFGLIGTPPKIFSFAGVFTGHPYIAAVLIGLGLGIVGPVSLTLAVDILTRFHGFTTEDASTPVGALQMMAVFLGTLVGPLLVGISSNSPEGASDGGLAVFIFNLLIMFSQVVLLFPFLFTDSAGVHKTESTPLKA